MLILTRKKGESIMIGDDVVVTLLGMQGNQARLGFDAPCDIKIHREEIYKKINQEWRREFFSYSDLSMTERLFKINSH